MAAPMRVAARAISLYKDVSIVRSVSVIPSVSGKVLMTSRMNQPTSIQPCRHVSFINKLTADQLWKGVLAEGSGALRRARGKRTKKRTKRDLNIGQIIGEGKDAYVWPGLNAPVMTAGMVHGIQKKDNDPEREKKLIEERDAWYKMKSKRLKRQRGWTGGTLGGTSLGSPDPIGNRTFEDFEARVLEMRNVFNMTANMGRKRSVRALVVVGNRKGAAGFAVGKALDARTALKKAKNKAVNVLYYIERYNNHTIYHDIDVTFQNTRIKMRKQNRGYGLQCHRILQTCGRLIGLEDVYARVLGAKNPLSIVHCFFKGLTKEQETHQQLADRKGLHVVEFRQECAMRPIVVASPSDGKVREEPELEDDIPDIKLDIKDVKKKEGTYTSPWEGIYRKEYRF
ncbi:small ribosomal subunit protein uS5m-like [Branchiostoma lanceolatum]|uniref:small ribosomal subunit protein uS5m-like n=1 Tax=Branchiostoma lanceolatum TaxID=7740 RepID=UPI003453D828